MPEAKKTGKVILRAVDSRKAAGVCTFSLGRDGMEAVVSAQLFSGGKAEAALQFGPERGYLCRPRADAAQPLRCGEPGIMAVWVLENGEPALFGQIVPGAFDRAAARTRLLGAPPDVRREEPAGAVKAASVPVTEPEPAELETPPREPSGEDMEVPFRSLILHACEGDPLLLLQPNEAEELPPPADLSEQACVLPCALPEEAEPIPEPESEAPEDAVTAAPEPPAPREVRAPAARERNPQAQPWFPLIVKRAPPPAPREPVYSPLWDDISSELEKMLETLPGANPFNGGGMGAEFVEVPTDGASQCYVGSVMVNGIKVFLQAVPARPTARPTGFDHTLVARSGECYWVKYFIEGKSLSLD